MARIALLLLVASTALAGYLLASSPLAAKTTSDQAGTTQLRVVVTGRGARDRVLQVYCPGSKLCKRLEATSRQAFAPVPKGKLCSSLYGGAGQAMIEGTLHGRPLRARFSLENGCQIARWQKLSWLLGRLPASVTGTAR